MSALGSEAVTDLVEQLAEISGIPLVRRGGTFLVAARDAVRFLEGARDAGVRVLGAQGFRIADQWIQPDTDAILDLSATDSAPRALDAAISFATLFTDSDLWFEFNLVPA